jgi:hypothetical protein
VTPTSSVDGVHVRLIWLELAAVAPSPEGTVGGVVSDVKGVTADATFEYALTLPPAFTARTR